MTQLFKSLSVMFAVATAGTLAAGCDLYFGDKSGQSDSWNYCGSDGYYQCNGDSCELVSSTCPGPGSATTGSECTSNTDCAAGCFCGSGTCTESGFCSQDSDCGTGYTCDVARSTCEPITTPPPVSCGSNADCSTGTVCNTTTGACDATCTCADDTDATDAGYGYCDETRGTCMTGVDPAGTCTAAVTCTTAAPACADNQVPLVLAGCYTGECRAIASCEGPTTCSALQHEDDCVARTGDCAPSYTGLDCTKKDGTACHAGDTGCTCATFKFASCGTKD